MAMNLKTPIIEIASEVTETYYRYHKAVDRVRALAVPKREWKTEVLWYYGPTGTGKSRKAFEITDDPYVHNMSSGKWFDGYEGQADVIFDDMRKDTFKFHELLRLFDRYQMKVEVKGSSVNWCPKRIIVTTCFRPEQMYETREDLQQLMRRIERVEHFPASVNDVLGKEKPNVTFGRAKRILNGEYKPKDFNAKRVIDIVEIDNDGGYEVDRNGNKGSYANGFEPPVIKN
jgi:hypothetical protein